MKPEDYYQLPQVKLPDWLSAQLPVVEVGLRLSTKIVPAKRIAFVLSQRINGDRLRADYRKINNQHVWLLIHELRRAGFPIGHNMKGYFWARRKSDLNAPLENLYSRRAGLSETIKALEIAQRNLPE